MTLVKVMGFTLLLCLVFLAVTHLLPQVEGEAPVDKMIDLDVLTMDGFIVMGEQIFNSKGNCTLCHKSPPLGRAPDIQGADMVAVAAERLADLRYKGVATDAETYLRESMKAPSQYVVAGWGKTGAKGERSPMPAAHKAPIGLSNIEIDAVIAYLQSKDGHEVTVALPTEATAPVADSVPTPTATAAAVIKKYSCQVCHVVDAVGGSVGPNLDRVGGRLTPEQIHESIINPNAVIAEGFVSGVMPRDFAEKMTVKELQLLVKWLAEKQP